MRKIDLDLCQASEAGDTEKVRELLDKGANVHADDDLSLRRASENGHTKTVELLIKYMVKEED